MDTAKLVFLILAVVCFVLDAFNAPKLKFVPIGLAFGFASFLV